jgi:penicillin-binding protein 1A
MRVLLAVGATRALDYVGRFGFDTSNFPRNTQLAIGGGTMAITPMQMATGYAAFANGGFLVTPNILREVRLQDGTVVSVERYPIACDTCQPEPDAAQVPTVADAASDTTASDTAAAVDAAEAPLLAPRVIDGRNVFLMTSMLQDVIRRGTARRASELERGDLAGKTGTTNEADNWFNGYQANLVATAWMGFSDHTPLGDSEYGSTGPLPIWIDFMRVALEGVPEATLQQPAGVVTMKIDPRTGDVAPPEQTDAIFEYFLAEHAPAYKPRMAVPGATPDDAAPVRPTDIF